MFLSVCIAVFLCALSYLPCFCIHGLNCIHGFLFLCFSAFCITPFSSKMFLNVSLWKCFFSNKQSYLNTLSQSESVRPVGGSEWIICLDNLDNLTATQLTVLSLSCLITDHRETQAAWGHSLPAGEEGRCTGSFWSAATGLSSSHHTCLQQTPKLGKWIHVSLKCLLAALNGICSIMTEIQ